MEKGEIDYVGYKLRNYSFLRLLGKGAWASVYEVFDDKADLRCACT